MFKIRETKQKQLIIDLIENSKNHYTAEEIFNIIRKKNSNISRATVFRNLKRLSENGIIKKLELSGSADRYDVFNPHYHAKCIYCKKIIDLKIPYNVELNNIVSSHQVIDHDLVFKIVCDKCKKKEG
ncbi:MAG: transcriptional repressor [Tenericutes bacterium]|jgi:Fe2+ or Zn2+ uptake regulation protein|nr:transcriptional repressor [Mycoplasmatota bacterium]